MLIDFSKLFDDNRHERDWRYSFLLNIMTDHTPNCYHWKEAFGVDVMERPTMIDVKVTVNGVEMPFDKWMDMLEKSYADTLERHAKKLLEDKLGKIQETLSKVEREAEIALGDAIAVQDGRCVNSEWILSQLAGQRFSEQGGAYDYVKKLLGR